MQTGKQRATLKGHAEPVYSLAYSPDGKTLASGSEDKTIRLWDIQTARERASLKGHTDSVHCLAYSPDGRTLASGSGSFTINDGQDDGQGEVALWEVATGKKRATLKGHTGPVLFLAYSPDGKRLASGSMDGTIKLYDAATGNERASLKGQEGWVLSIAFSPDGKTLASGSAYLTLGRVWAMDEMAERVEINLWDIATGRRRTARVPGTRVVVTYSRDDKTLASAGENPTIRLWDMQTGKERASLKGHAEQVHSVAFSPDSKTLASASEDQTIKLWNVQTDKRADK